jgi:predicted transporter
VLNFGVRAKRPGLAEWGGLATTMSQEREQQNSSCAMFLSILFVLMLFGSGGHDATVATRDTYHVSCEACLVSVGVCDVYVCVRAVCVWTLCST